jgi:hypothetical protein
MPAAIAGSVVAVLGGFVVTQLSDPMAPTIIIQQPPVPPTGLVSETPMPNETQLGSNAPLSVPQPKQPNAPSLEPQQVNAPLAATPLPLPDITPSSPAKPAVVQTIEPAISAPVVQTGRVTFEGNTFTGLCGKFDGKAAIQTALQQVVLTVSDGPELALRLGGPELKIEECSVTLTDLTRLAYGARAVLRWETRQ